MTLSTWWAVIMRSRCLAFASSSPTEVVAKTLANCKICQNKKINIRESLQIPKESGCAVPATVCRCHAAEGSADVLRWVTRTAKLSGFDDA